MSQLTDQRTPLDCFLQFCNKSQTCLQPISKLLNKLVEHSGLVIDLVSQQQLEEIAIAIQQLDDFANQVQQLCQQDGNIGDQISLETLWQEINTAIKQFNIAFSNTSLESKIRSVENLTGRMLLVDDQVPIQHLVQLFCNKTNINLVIANNGEKAVEEALKSDFDLILMDLQMPIMNGAEATELLRSAGVEIPIIAFTTIVDKQIIDNLLLNGFDRYLPKPVAEDTFFSAISEFLSDENQIKQKTAENANNSIFQSEGYQQIKSEFIASIPAKVKHLEHTFNVEDWDQMKSIAHQLKGSCGSFRLTQLSDLMKQLEHSLHSGHKQQVKVLLNLVVHKVHRKEYS